MPNSQQPKENLQKLIIRQTTWHIKTNVKIMQKGQFKAQTKQQAPYLATHMCVCI